MGSSIIAIDPGGTTGIATFSYNTRLWHTFQIPYDPIRLYEFFASMLDNAHDSASLLDTVTVICESFDYRPVGKYNFGGNRSIPKVDLIPRNVIGILELACAYAKQEIIWQKPSCVNGDDGSKSGDPNVFWTNDRLTMLGLYKRSQIHAMDATKHILYYRAFTKKEEYLFHALRPGKSTAFEEGMR